MNAMKLLIALICLFPSLIFAQGYNRSDWAHWDDFDRDCQNTRHELLIARSFIEVTYTSPTGCYVATGAWQGAYTGKIFTLASEVDIDHVIPLRYAHEYGGENWSALVKKLFANDPENLLITQSNENRIKGWKGPSQYMPRDESYHCEYARSWLYLTRKYELTLMAADMLAVAAITNTCRSQNH